MRVLSSEMLSTVVGTAQALFRQQSCGDFLVSLPRHRLGMDPNARGDSEVELGDLNRWWLDLCSYKGEHRGTS